MPMTYRDGQTLRTGDIFTAVGWQGVRTWIVTEVNNEIVRYKAHEGADVFEEDHVYSVNRFYNIIRHWIFVRSSVRKKTGFGAFIQRIET